MHCVIDYLGLKNKQPEWLPGPRHSAAATIKGYNFNENANKSYCQSEKWVCICLRESLSTSRHF